MSEYKVQETGLLLCATTEKLKTSYKKRESTHESSFKHVKPESSTEKLVVTVVRWISKMTIPTMHSVTDILGVCSLLLYL